MPSRQRTPQQSPAPLQPQTTADAAGLDLSAHGNGFLQDNLFGAFGDLGLGFGGLGLTPEQRAQQEMETFFQRCWIPQNDFATGTGGLFDAHLDGHTLTITLKVAYNWVNGSPADAPVGVPAAELVWTREQQDAFRADFASSITGVWSGQHQIRSTRPFWDSARVDVVIRVLEDERDPHFKITCRKLPPDAGSYRSSVCDAGTHHNAAGTACPANPPGDNTGTGEFTSRDVDPGRVRNGSQAMVWIYFEQGKSEVRAGERNKLNTPIANLTANPAWSVELRGHASAEGGEEMNFLLSRAREEAVKTEFTGGGISASRILVDNSGEQGATANNAVDRRVDVHVLDVQTQTTSSHEAGHMFGLGDEYLDTGEAPGTQFDASYRQLIANNATIPAGGLPAKGATDSIMSNGMDVMNWHYAPFVAALKAITGTNDWTV